jgi:hypothetical protein
VQPLRDTIPATPFLMADPVIERGDDLTIIQIDFDPGSPDAARVFRAMAGLIDAFYRIDRDLAHAVAAEIEPEIRLERVEAGSIRAFLKTVLVQVDDDALRNLDWKPLIGQYLVAGKHTILEWLDGRPRITDRRDILGLRDELRSIAPLNDDQLLPPAPVPLETLLWDIEGLSRAVIQLRPGDSAKFISARDETRIETRLVVTPLDIESLLTESVVRADSTVNLLVKKPDYLGRSMWEFRVGDRIIEATMDDEQWLEKFRAGEIPLQPGDALKTHLLTKTARGFEGHDVSTHYSVLRVLAVVHGDVGRQGDLLSS